jgi:hypothetical protein
MDEKPKTDVVLGMKSYEIALVRLKIKITKKN